MTEEQTTPTFEEPHWDRDLASLYIKMSRVMGRLERVPKRGQNQHFNYAYVTDSDVLGAVRKAMAQEGLAFFVDVGELEKEGKIQKVHLAIMFCDGETGATKTIHWVGEAMDSQDKGINKAITAGVKYALLKTFLMSTGEGDDPDGGGAEGAERKGWPAGIVSAIVDAHLAQNTPNTTKMLNLSKVLQPSDSKERIMTWATLYRSARGEMESKDAASTADTELVKQETEETA